MEIDKPRIKRLALSKIPLFESLTSEEREKLCETIQLRDYKKGEAILSSEQSGREILFVADGSVDVKRTSGDGREVIISRMGVGNFIGEIAFLTKSTRTADVVAVEDCMVLVLQPQDFETLLDTSGAFARALMVDLAHRVAAASGRITDLALLDVYSRLYRVLKGLAVTKGGQAPPVVLERPTHKDLASMVGTSREMITRALAKLEADEIISIRDGAVLLTGALSD